MEGFGINGKEWTSSTTAMLSHRNNAEGVAGVAVRNVEPIKVAKGISYRVQRGSRPIIVRLSSEQGYMFIKGRNVLLPLIFSGWGHK